MAQPNEYTQTSPIYIGTENAPPVDSDNYSKELQRTCNNVKKYFLDPQFIKIVNYNTNQLLKSEDCCDRHPFSTFFQLLVFPLMNAKYFFSFFLLLKFSQLLGLFSYHHIMWSCVVFSLKGKKNMIHYLYWWFKDICNEWVWACCKHKLSCLFLLFIQRKKTLCGSVCSNPIPQRCNVTVIKATLSPSDSWLKKQKTKKKFIDFCFFWSVLSFSHAVRYSKYTHSY